MHITCFYLRKTKGPYDRLQVELKSDRQPHGKDLQSFA